MLREKTLHKRVITATELRRNFTVVVKRIHKSREHTVIESKGSPVAVIMSVEEYEELSRHKKLAEFKRLAREIGKAVEESGLTEKQLMEELEETKREVFREQYGSL